MRFPLGLKTITMAAVFFSSGTFAQAWGGGEWRERIDRYIDKSGCGRAEDVCPAGHARAQVKANALFVDGTGSAEDITPFCDVTAVAVALGHRHREWFFISFDRVTSGRAYASSSVWIHGFANIPNADSAAAALGYTRFSSSITNPIRAELSRSVAETGSGLLGDLGWETTVPITIGLGEGNYPDEDLESTANRICTDFFFLAHTTKGYIKVFANGGLDFAECDALVYGTINTHYELDLCPCRMADPTRR